VVSCCTCRVYFCFLQFFWDFLISLRVLHKWRIVFFVYALSPVLYNVGIIFGLLFLAPQYGILGVVYGVVCGALLHMAIQVPFVIHAGLLPVPTTKLLLGDIFRVTHISLWRALTLSSHEIARLILIAIAGSMVVGSISVFTFALNLQSVPLSIIAVSYSLAAFPMLTKDIVNGNKENFVKNMISGCRYIIFLSMPVMVIFVVLRAQIVRTILGSGEFTWADTKLTAACLALFAFSIIPQSLVILFTRAYYAKGNTQIPLYINAISGVVMIVLGYALIAWHNAHVTVQYFFESLFKVEDVVGSGVLMLALAYSLALWIAFLAYWFVFAREYKTFAQPVLHTTFQSFAASILLGFITYKSFGSF
jgi:putative peptidoglycan lipid II flippase